MKNDLLEFIKDKKKRIILIIIYVILLIINLLIYLISLYKYQSIFLFIITLIISLVVSLLFIVNISKLKQDIFYLDLYQNKNLNTFSCLFIKKQGDPITLNKEQYYEYIFNIDGINKSYYYSTIFDDLNLICNNTYIINSYNNILIGVKNE